MKQFDTTDYLRAKHIQLSVFEEVADEIKRKELYLKDYAAKEGANKAYVDRENKFLDTIARYINTTEILMEQIELVKQDRDETVKEALEILTQVEELTSKWKAPASE